MGNVDLIKWRNEGRHLPRFMRDFHDQKDLFKAIASIPAPRDTIAAVEVSWIQAHVYTMDRFLWFMARHGYVLRKSGARLPFCNIDQTLAVMTAERRESEANMLRGLLQKSEAGEP